MEESKEDFRLITEVIVDLNSTAQKLKFSVKYFFSKCDQIRSVLRIWSHLLKKSLMENFIFCTVLLANFSSSRSLLVACSFFMDKVWQLTNHVVNNQMH